MQLVLQHCCKMGWIAMLRVLPSTFKPVNNLICYKTGLMWGVKRATSLFNLCCSNVARQVARFLLPVFPYLKHILRVFIENDNWYLEFECDWLLNKIHLARDHIVLQSSLIVQPSSSVWGIPEHEAPAKYTLSNPRHNDVVNWQRHYVGSHLAS